MKINEVVLNEGLWSNLKYAAGRAGAAVKGTVGIGNNTLSRSMISKYEQIAKNGWLKRIRPYEIWFNKQAQLKKSQIAAANTNLTQQSQNRTAQPATVASVPQDIQEAQVSQEAQTIISAIPTIIASIMMDDFHIPKNVLSRPEISDTLKVIGQQAAQAYSRRDSGTLRQLFHEIGEMAFQINRPADGGVDTGDKDKGTQEPNQNTTNPTQPVQASTSDNKQTSPVAGDSKKEPKTPESKIYLENMEYDGDWSPFLDLVKSTLSNKTQSGREAIGKRLSKYTNVTRAQADVAAPYIDATSLGRNSSFSAVFLFNVLKDMPENKRTSFMKELNSIFIQQGVEPIYFNPKDFKERLNKR